MPAIGRRSTKPLNDPPWQRAVPRPLYFNLGNPGLLPLFQIPTKLPIIFILLFFFFSYLVFPLDAPYPRHYCHQTIEILSFDRISKGRYSDKNQNYSKNVRARVDFFFFLFFFCQFDSPPGIPQRKSQQLDRNAKAFISQRGQKNTRTQGEEPVPGLLATRGFLGNQDNC